MGKVNFQNLPNTTTPLNASNLNAIQQNIARYIDFSLNANESKTLTFTQAQINLLFSAKGGLAVANELWYIGTYGAGDSRTLVSKIYDGSGINYSISGQTITLTNTLSTQFKCCALVLVGDVSDITIS